MQLLRTYFQFVRASRRKLSLVVLLSVVGAVFQGASVGLLLPALQLVENPDTQGRSGVIWQIIESVYDPLGIPVTLLSLLLAVLAMIVIGQALIYAQKHIGAAMSEDLVAGLRRHTFTTFMRADLSFHHSVRTGTLTNALTQDLQRTGSTFEGLIEMMTRSILVAMFITTLFLVSWSTALTALGIVLAAALLIQYLVQVSKRIGKQMVETHKVFHGFAVERIEAARLVKISNAQKRDSGRFGEISEEVASVRAHHLRCGAQIRLILEPSLAAGGIAAIYIGLTYFSMSLAELAAFLYVLARIVPEAHSLNRSRYNVAGYASHFHNVMKMVRQAETQTTITRGKRPLHGLRHDITFEDASFSYDGSSPVLHNISLTVKANQLTAIVGPSGVGKSTMLDLIVRLIDPTSGRVLLDGTDVREFDLVALHREISLVSQDVQLFNDTVLDNIRYSLPEASEEEVVEAAKQANAHGFIQAFPQGYHTLLGPRGMTVSGGERQRIALARALLPKPSVLLLDEVTSNLDVESERLIQESVFQAARDRTVIAATHRLTMVQRADKVVVLDQGRIVEEGTPAALANNNGVFQKYLQLQMDAQHTL